MKLFFWIVIAIDIAILLMFFLLGLAAAGSTGDSAARVAAYMLLVPGALLAGIILLFLRSTSPAGRGLALLLAISPVAVVAVMRGVEAVRLRLNLNEQGELAHFRAGPLRQMADAIARNDSATVATLAPQVDLNARGYAGTTLLLLSLRRLRESPGQAGTLQALLAGGADPNLANVDLPLAVAIQASGSAGARPVAMLLDAGADPNVKDEFGTPVWFRGAGRTVPPEVLETLIDHGADLTVRDKGDRTIVFYAATSGNWRAVLTLLERGVPWKEMRSLNGESFPGMVEHHARVFGDTAGVKEVIEYLKTR